MVLAWGCDRRRHLFHEALTEFTDTRVISAEGNDYANPSEVLLGGLYDIPDNDLQVRFGGGMGLNDSVDRRTRALAGVTWKQPAKEVSASRAQSQHETRGNDAQRPAQFYIAVPMSRRRHARGRRVSEKGSKNIRTVERTCNGHPELCERPLNAITLATTHNASSESAGWIAPNQGFGITQQLEDGIRGMMLDTRLD